MPSKNRIAGYPPDHIFEAFCKFKDEAGISESKAIIKILAEYFQVTQEVAYSSSSNLLQRIEVIEERLNGLKSELLSELKSELQLAAQPKTDKKESEPLSELQGELLVESKLSSELKSNTLQVNPMSGAELSRRFTLQGNSVAKAKNRYKDNPERFTEWLKSKDPDGYLWEYDQTDKLYHPVQSLNPSQGRGAEQSGVANP